MRIIWAPQALGDLVHIRAYIAQDNVAVGKTIVQTIIKYCENQLLSFPNSGHAGRVSGTFELTIPKLPYVIPYRVHNDTIQILRVYHTSRLWPMRF